MSKGDFQLSNRYDLDNYIVCHFSEPKPGTCPAVDGGFGTCAEECQHDMDCEGHQKCCSNGCGHTCVNAIPGTVMILY